MSKTSQLAINELVERIVENLVNKSRKSYETIQLNKNCFNIQNNSAIFIHLPNFSVDYTNGLIFKFQHYKLNLRDSLDSKTILDEYLIHRRCIYIVTTQTTIQDMVRALVYQNHNKNSDNLQEILRKNPALNKYLDGSYQNQQPPQSSICPQNLFYDNNNNQNYLINLLLNEQQIINLDRNYYKKLVNHLKIDPDKSYLKTLINQIVQPVLIQDFVKITKRYVPTSFVYHIDTEKIENSLKYYIVNNMFGHKQVFGIRRKNLDNPKDKYQSEKEQKKDLEFLQINNMKHKVSRRVYNMTFNNQKNILIDYHNRKNQEILEFQNTVEKQQLKQLEEPLFPDDYHNFNTFVSQNYDDKYHNIKRLSQDSIDRKQMYERVDLPQIYLDTPLLANSMVFYQSEIENLKNNSNFITQFQKDMKEEYNEMYMKMLEEDEEDYEVELGNFSFLREIDNSQQGHFLNEDGFYEQPMICQVCDNELIYEPNQLFEHVNSHQHVQNYNIQFNDQQNGGNSISLIQCIDDEINLLKQKQDNRLNIKKQIEKNGNQIYNISNESSVEQKYRKIINKMDLSQNCLLINNKDLNNIEEFLGRNLIKQFQESKQALNESPRKIQKISINCSSIKQISHLNSEKKLEIQQKKFKRSQKIQCASGNSFNFQTQMKIMISPKNIKKISKQKKQIYVKTRRQKQLQQQQYNIDIRHFQIQEQNVQNNEIEKKSLKQKREKNVNQKNQNVQNGEYRQTKLTECKIFDQILGKRTCV